MKTYKNMSGLEFVVIKKMEARKVLVQFLVTGSVVKADGRNLAAGKVADPYHITRCGVGYMGDYKKTSYHKQAYQLWSNMLKRCYDKNDPKGYTGVEVSANWRCYATFLRDLPCLTGFDKWVSKCNYQLDKDLKGTGKLYSLYTCEFIPEFDNKSAGKKGKRLVDGVWVTPKL